MAVTTPKLALLTLVGLVAVAAFAYALSEKGNQNDVYRRAAERLSIDEGKLRKRHDLYQAVEAGRDPTSAEWAEIERDSISGSQGDVSTASNVMVLLSKDSRYRAKAGQLARKMVTSSDPFVRGAGIRVLRATGATDWQALGVSDPDAGVRELTGVLVKGATLPKAKR